MRKGGTDGNAGRRSPLLAQAIALTLTLTLTFMTAAAAPVSAASRLYDMDRMLKERHPFATAAPAATRPARAPSPVAAPAASAGGDSSDVEDLNDPLEPMNRAIFSFNEFFLEWVLGPLASGYRAITPDPVRRGIGNILDNLASPTILMNDLLQGELRRAWVTTERMLINTTMGGAGFFDVASKLDIPKHKEDLGQTLAVWGVGEGFYLVVPFFGPSNPRDGFGLLADAYVHPLTLWATNTDRDEINYGIFGATVVHRYSTLMDTLADVRGSSLDYYSALRSIYRQRRRTQIANQETDDSMSLEDDLLDLEIDLK